MGIYFWFWMKVFNSLVSWEKMLTCFMMTGCMDRYGHGHGNTKLSDQLFTDCYNSLITMDWTGCASASTPANMGISGGTHNLGSKWYWKWVISVQLFKWYFVILVLSRTFVFLIQSENIQILKTFSLTYFSFVLFNMDWTWTESHMEVKSHIWYCFVIELDDWTLGWIWKWHGTNGIRRLKTRSPAETLLIRK